MEKRPRVAPDTVTVGLPTYNSASYVLGAVASIFAQSHHEWRLLAIDDGSQDETVTILRGICDERVTVLADGHNLGLAARLNQIIALADTELVFRMDADDVMHPRRLESQIAAMHADPDVQILGSRCYAIDEQRHLLGVFREGEIARTPRGWLMSRGISHPTVAMRTEWARNHPYDAALRRSEDLDLWTRVGDTKIGKIEQCLMFYTIPTRLSVANYRTSRQHDRIIMRRLAATGCLGWGALMTHSSESVAKEFMVLMAHTLKLDGLIRAHWTAALTEGEASQAQAALATALNAYVPRRR